MLAGIQGRTAVVTGAGGAIGAAMVRRLVAEGANVVGVDLRAESMAGLADLGDAFSPFAADVSTEDGNRGLVAHAVERYGSLDLFAANAGIEAQVRDVVDFDVADFHRVIGVNLLGAFLGAREVLDRMLQQETRGSIVFTASVGGLKGTPGLSIYNASKHGVVGLAKALALEIGSTGVRVNTICPGPVETRMIDAINEGRSRRLGITPEEARASSQKANAQGRYGEPSEVAATAVFLLSDESRYMHGEVVSISGGGV